MSMIDEYVGYLLTNLAESHSKWSQETFGSDEIKGPLGSILHLQKEINELLENPKDIKEYADVLLLTLDASRRAGFDIVTLLEATSEKLQENKTRKWNLLNRKNIDEPVEHQK